MTGSYNMEYSAGIPVTPSLLNLDEVSRFPFGLTYTFALAGKLVIYVLVLLHTLTVTVLHLRGRIATARLRRAYLVGATGLGLLLSGLTAVVLLLHEAVDLYPSALHVFGGRLGPRPPAPVGGPGGQVASDSFAVLGQGPVLAAIVLRWLHLLGFGLWLGLTALSLVRLDESQAPDSLPRRLLGLNLVLGLLLAYLVMMLLLVHEGVDHVL